MTDVPDAGMLREYNEIAKRLEELADQESMPEKGELARRVARRVRNLASDEREAMILEYLMRLDARLDARLDRIESRLDGGKD